MTPGGPVGEYQCFGGTSSRLKMEAVCSSKMLVGVSTYKSTRRHNPEVRHGQGTSLL
jgi:hypothetical protein